MQILTSTWHFFLTHIHNFALHSCELLALKLLSMKLQVEPRNSPWYPPQKSTQSFFWLPWCEDQNRGVCSRNCIGSLPNLWGASFSMLLCSLVSSLWGFWYPAHMLPLQNMQSGLPDPLPSVALQTTGAGTVSTSSFRFFTVVSSWSAVLSDFLSLLCLLLLAMWSFSSSCCFAFFFSGFLVGFLPLSFLLVLSNWLKAHCDSKQAYLSNDRWGSQQSHVVSSSHCFQSPPHCHLAYSSHISSVHPGPSSSACFPLSLRLGSGFSSLG